MTHHTPGPWNVEDDFTIMAEVGAHIATVSDPDDFPCIDRDESDMGAIEAECKANAQLIAASPDLLRACKLFLSVIGIMTDGPDDSDTAMAVSKLVEAKKLATEAIRKIDPDGSLYA